MWQKDWFSKWALYSPEKIALKEYETGRCLSYYALNESSEKAASLLSNIYEIKKHDRIAVLADFCLEYLCLFGAAQKMGFILVPLNYRLAANELNDILIDAEPSIIIVENKYAQILSEDLDIPTLPVDRLWNIIDSDNSETTFNNLPTASIAIEDPIFLLYTSGTSGRPKGVLYTHKMLFWNSINTSISLVLNSESRTVVVMPPYHTGGWNVLLTPFLHHGAYVCLCKKFDAAKTLNLLEAEKATLFMGVPTMLQMMADQPGFEKSAFPNLLYLITGGESMSIPLIEKWDQKGVKVRQGYGMTEVGPNLTSLHQDDAIRKIGSIGRPNFYVETRVVNENNEDSEPNESGELWLSGPMVTPGYWKNPALTIQAFSEDGRWFKTGDIVRCDNESYYYIVDRLKNMFISGGENIYPAEIERVLIQHPDIKECAVVGVPDEKWGYVGKAFIVYDNQKSNIEDISNFLSEKIARFKVPKHFTVLDELPKNDAGKIDRISLLKVN